jgi:Ca2+-binding EF-hand superfamily protein
MRWRRRAPESGFDLWMPNQFLFAAALLLSTTSAFGQSRDDFLHRVDSDGDGRVSVSEYQFHMSFAFRQMDRNNDQILEPDEQLIPNAKPLTRVELDARMAAQFRRQDRNHDGYLNAAELSAPPQP